MSLLVLHDLPAGTPAAHALTAAVFEISPTHWEAFPGALVVAAEVSASYLRDHLQRALRLAKQPPARLLVAPMAPGAVSDGLSPEGSAWLSALDRGEGASG